MKKTKPTGFTLVELLVVVGILTILVSMTFPAIQMIREAARRIHCSANMRQVALALHSYENYHGRLPETLSLKRTSLLLHWQARLLPFLEQTSLKANIDEKLSNHIHVYHMVEERTTNLAIFQCSSNPDIGLLVQSQIGFLFAYTDYCGVAGIEARDEAGVFTSNYRREGTRFAEITDGLSNTLLFGERPPNHRGHGYGAWLGSQNALAVTIGVYESKDSLRDSEDLGECEHSQFGFGNDSRESRCNWTHHWSYHPKGANFASGDGSVGFIPYSISPSILQALATRAGGESVTISF